MPLQAQQLITLCCQEAKVPSWTTQAGMKLNLILNELCSYDLDVTQKVYQFNFNTSLGSGPIPLPTDWLRANKADVFYTILGVKYVMIPVSTAQFDAFVHRRGSLNILSIMPWITRRGRRAPGRTFRLASALGGLPGYGALLLAMPDIVTPESSTTIPWVSYERELYLQRRLTGEMMLMANDDRATRYLNGETKSPDGTFFGSSAILKRYLDTRDDAQQVKAVTLDRRLFGQPFNKLNY